MSEVPLYRSDFTIVTVSQKGAQFRDRINPIRCFQTRCLLAGIEGGVSSFRIGRTLGCTPENEGRGEEPPAK